MIWFRRKPLPLGARGETLAVKFLRRNGYTILERNSRLGRYEIDIIARDADTIAFVEVKTRRTGELFPPEDNVDHVKRRHICAAADRYLERLNDPTLYARFDIVTVVMPEGERPRIELLRDAFHAE